MPIIKNQNLHIKNREISEKLRFFFWTILVVGCVFLISSCSSSYHDHFFRENIDLKTWKNIVSSEPYIARWELISLPNPTTQQDLIKDIENAKKRIWIEIYTWTEAAKILDPILNAHNRWVDIRIVLEWNVFGTPYINTPIVKKLQQAWIEVIYADNHRYAFTHAKFWIIDDTYFISTGNWTASFFNKNREYIYADSDEQTRWFLEKIFLSDSAHLGFKDATMIPDHIVISPLDTRKKISRLIQSAKSNIVLYVQTLSDDEMLSLLSESSKKWIKIHICTADNESNAENIAKFPELSWKMIRKPYLHAKVIVIDDSIVFVWSHNLTNNAIENNREMGIIIKNRDDIVRKIDADFKTDKCR